MRLPQPQSKLHRLVLTTYVGAVEQTPSALLPLVHPQANLKKPLRHYLPSPKVQALLGPESLFIRCRLWKVNKLPVKHIRHCTRSARSLLLFLCGGCHLDPLGRYPTASFRLLRHVEAPPTMSSSALLTISRTDTAYGENWIISPPMYDHLFDHSISSIHCLRIHIFLNT